MDLLVPFLLPNVRRYEIASVGSQTLIVAQCGVRDALAPSRTMRATLDQGKYVDDKRRAAGRCGRKRARLLRLTLAVL